MSAASLVVCGIAAIVAVVNVATMRRLWASKIFERPQKIAQTILLWVLPGSFLAVRAVLGVQRALGPSDPTLFPDRNSSYASAFAFGDYPRHASDTSGGGDGGFGESGGGGGFGDGGGGDAGGGGGDAGA